MSDPILSSFLLGIVEGITEFLPISSTGHMIVVGSWIGFKGPFARTFDIAIQFGAILGVVVYFRDRLRAWARRPLFRGEGLHPFLLVLLAFMPAAVIGLLFHDLVEGYLMTPQVVGLALILGGVAIEAIERTRAEPAVDSVEQVTPRQALIVGFMQCLALIPGTSRSAATIMGGLLLGMSRTVAAEFSFFLAIPTMAAASAYSVLKSWDGISTAQLQLVGLGFVTSFVVGLAAVAFFLKYLRYRTFRVFSIYRVLFGTLVLALGLCEG